MGITGAVGFVGTALACSQAESLTHMMRPRFRQLLTLAE